MSKIKAPEEFFKHQTEEIPDSESCFNGVREVEWWDGNVEDDVVYSTEQMIAFAQSYHEYAMKAVIEELEATKKIVWDETERGQGLMHGLNEAIEILKSRI